MTRDPMDHTRDVPEMPDPALDTLLRRHDRGAPPVALGEPEARILSAAAFQLAARRRTARTSMADTLAAWVRVALPMAAAAALIAAVFLSRMDSSTLAEADLRESDPAALLSALESDGSSGLAHHVIDNDASAGAIELEPR